MSANPHTWAGLSTGADDAESWHSGKSASGRFGARSSASVSRELCLTEYNLHRAVLESNGQPAAVLQ